MTIYCWRKGWSYSWNFYIGLMPSLPLPFCKDFLGYYYLIYCYQLLRNGFLILILIAFHIHFFLFVILNFCFFLSGIYLLYFVFNWLLNDNLMFFFIIGIILEWLICLSLYCLLVKLVDVIKSLLLGVSFVFYSYFLVVI